MRRLLIPLAAAAALAVQLLVAPASGYVVEGKTWPKGVVPYYNAAKDQAAAVREAVKAWNESGARVRFVAVPRSKARLVIGHFGLKSCAKAEATLGMVTGARVRIWPASAEAKDEGCGRYWTVRALTHELGHVLGLGHTGEVCALMNTSGDYFGNNACLSTKVWQWRCRLLERDDVLAAVHAYGGRARPVRKQAACPLYEALAAPNPLGWTDEDGGDRIVLSFRRPAPARIPDFLLPWTSEPGYVVHHDQGECPTEVDLATGDRAAWSVESGEVEEFYAEAPPAGRWCYAIWAVDELLRPSAKPATIWVSG